MNIYDLGSLRLWQNELAEIVRLIRQLPNVEVRLESDNNLLTDVHADLPQLGQRVNYFTVTATRPRVGDEPGKDVISVKLAKRSCLIEATEPDLTTTGLIENIKSLVGNNRRLPSWLMPLYRTSPGDPAPGNPGLLLLMALLIAGGAVFIIGVIQHLAHAHGKPVVSWPTSISVAVPCLVIIAALGLGLARGRTLLFTATREDAPTFWQRKRSDIAINVIVALMFYLLGLATAHL